MSQGDPTGNCVYECTNGTYVLTGGNAPPGHVCPQTMGACNTPGRVLHAPPVPLGDPPMFAAAPFSDGESGASASSTLNQNSAIYVYQLSTGMLFFSSGQADNGYGFFPSLTLQQLQEYYPSIAEDLSVLQGVQTLASFTLSIPALPAESLVPNDE